MTYIVFLGAGCSNEYGVYLRSRLIFRGTFDECIAYRRERGI